MIGPDQVRVVAIGGGTGLSTLLRGLKRHTAAITAVVTVSDDGGSSGRLREELGVLPPGDVRNCLVALADDESLMSALFSYRFSVGGLAGHSFGNLFLAALTEVIGDFEQAIKESSKILAIRGTVLPGTTDDVHLHAVLSDGRHLAGESCIGRSPASVERVWLEPPHSRAVPLALERIAGADLIVLGPGSLFTSVLPNLLVDEVREALGRAAAPVVYVANVMTQPGETMGFTALDHLDALIDHIGTGIIDIMLANATRPEAQVRLRYAEEGAEPVVWFGGDTVHRGVKVVGASLLEGGDQARHDPGLLARAVLLLAPDRAVARATAG